VPTLSCPQEAEGTGQSEKHAEHGRRDPVDGVHALCAAVTDRDCIHHDRAGHCHRSVPEREFKRRFSPYVLRHTMATLNYLDGMPLELLSRRLGHTDPMFTFKRYGQGVRAQHTNAAAANFDLRMAKVRRAALKVS
jgi:integrase